MISCDPLKRNGWVQVVASLFFLLILKPLPSPGISAQQVRGHLLESGTSQPIPLGLVALLDTAFSPVTQSLANENGAFLLEAPEPGAYYVLAEALAYSPTVDGILDLGPGGSISVEIYLTPKPIELDSLKVALTRVRWFQNLSEVGYYDRMKMGFGSFITPEQIERRNPASVYELLRLVPDLHFGAQTLAGTRVFLVRGGSPCTPRVYVDGGLVMNDVLTESMGPQVLNPPPTTPENVGPQQPDPSAIDLQSRLRSPTRYPGVVLDALVNPQDISAIEVHTRATSIPLVYGGTQDTCGVILIWTHLATEKEPLGGSG